MKRNKLLLSDQLYVKLFGDALTSIVTEAFLDSLPFNKNALAAESEGLARYATNVVASLHPETLIERALEVTTNPMQREYLETLRDEISAVVETAVTRIVNSEYLGTASTPDIVKQAKFDDDEIAALVRASQKSGISAVSNVVKKNLISNIKDERESFERSEKLHTELKEIIKDETKELKDSLEMDDEEENPEIIAGENLDSEGNPNPEAEEPKSETDATVESYLNIILGSTDPRHPISVFSRLQDVCMENLLLSNESVEREIPFDTLEKITLESTFPFFDLGTRSIMDEVRSLQISLESEVALAQMTPEEKAHKVKSISKTSLICTICILTMLEVLKTMNLKKPDVATVRDFVDQPTNVQNTSDEDIARIEKKIGDATDDIHKSVALGALSATETQDAKNALNKVKAVVESMNIAPNRKGVQKNILNRLSAAIEYAISDPDRIIRTDSVSVRIRESNITNLEHSIKVVCRRPDVVRARVCVDSTTPMGDDNSSVTVKVVGLNALQAEVCQDFFQFCTAEFLGENIAAAMHETAGAINFQLGHKPVELWFIDQGYGVPLFK